MIKADRTAGLPEKEQSDLRMMVDGEGFLVDLEDWTEEVARALAASEGIESLTEKQLDILKSLRIYYRKHAFFPILRAVCTSVHQTRSCIAENFRDPVTAWKIAGLPNPGEQVNRFRSWEPLGY
jgi:tRNA 2-thiouridine synthesizing protein E